MKPFVFFIVCLLMLCPFRLTAQANTTLPAPMLLQPPDNAENTPLFTTLEWSSVQGATLYDLHVSGDPGFFTTVQRDSMIAPTTTRRTVGEIFPGTTLYWRVRAKQISGTTTIVSAWSAARSFTAMRATSVLGTVPENIVCHISPNPAHDLVRVQIRSKEALLLRLSLFSALGQEIMSLPPERIIAGDFAREFDASHLPQGMYILRVQAGNHQTSSNTFLRIVPLTLLR